MYHTAVTQKDHVAQIFTVSWKIMGWRLAPKEKKKKRKSSEASDRKSSKRDFPSAADDGYQTRYLPIPLRFWIL